MRTQLRWLVCLVWLVELMSCGGAAARVVWLGDASRPADLEWASSAAAGGACAVASPNPSTPGIQRVPAPLGPGETIALHPYAYRFQVSDGDDCFGSRAELGQANPENPQLGDRKFYPGQERWIAWRVFLPSNYQLNDPSGYSTGIMQLKQIGSYGYPAVSITNSDGYLCLYVDSMHDRHESAHCGQGYYDIGRPAKNTWLELMVHVRFSGSSDGLIELYGDLQDHDGYRLLVPAIHGATSKLDEHGQALPTQARIGIYRNALVHGTEDLYIDGFTASTDRASAEASAFGVVPLVAGTLIAWLAGLELAGPLGG